MILRLSQKLRTKIKVGSLSILPAHDNPYADWSAHLFIVKRTHYIIISNTQSLYSIVMPGRGITTEDQFIERAMSHLREFMEKDGQSVIYRRYIASACATVHFSRSLGRTVTGSMNELIKHATAQLAEGDDSSLDVGFVLNDVLLSGISSSKYGKPREVFESLNDGNHFSAG